MPTYPQLELEASWRAEFVPPNLAKVITALRRKWPNGEYGTKGNNLHDYGYHRSRRWILSSRWSRFGRGDYSVQHPLDKLGNENWIRAFDVYPGTDEELFAMCRRVDVATRAGRLEKVREWYGTFGDDDRVDGWNNILDRIASSDPSHLKHLHGSLFCAHANDDHSDLIAVLTGDDMSLNFNERAKLNALVDMKETMILDVETPAEDGTGAQQEFPVAFVIELNQLAAKVDRLSSGGVDIAALAAALAPLMPKPPVPPTAKEVADLLAARLKD